MTLCFFSSARPASAEPDADDAPRDTLLPPVRTLDVAAFEPAVSVVPAWDNVFEETFASQRALEDEPEDEPVAIDDVDEERPTLRYIQTSHATLKSAE